MFACHSYKCSRFFPQLAQTHFSTTNLFEWPRQTVFLFRRRTACRWKMWAGIVAQGRGHVSNAYWSVNSPLQFSMSQLVTLVHVSVVRSLMAESTVMAPKCVRRCCRSHGRAPRCVVRTVVVLALVRQSRFSSSSWARWIILIVSATFVPLLINGEAAGRSCNPACIELCPWRRSSL